MRDEPQSTALSDPRSEAAVMWKVAVRLLPFLFLLYVVNILDRTNIGFASLQMVASPQEKCG